MFDIVSVTISSSHKTNLRRGFMKLLFYISATCFVPLLPFDRHILYTLPIELSSECIQWFIHVCVQLFYAQVPTTLVPHKRSADEKNSVFETMKETINEVGFAKPD